MEEQQVYEMLKALNIPYRNQYHTAITSVKNLDFTLEGQQVKNLVLKSKKGNRVYLVLLHDEKSVNLNRLAEMLEEKRLSFANDDTLRTLLHCEAGIVTPFGLVFDTEHKITVIIDKDVDPTLTLGFHPFKNTVTTDILFTDFIKFIEHTGHQWCFLETGE